MPRNEEGEFILELGHRQLLSVFFIVVILLGVSFTMGYIVGRNSAPVVATVIPAEAPDGAVTSAVGQSPTAAEPALAPGQVLVNQAVPSATVTMPAQPPAKVVEPAAPAAPVAARPAPTTTTPVVDAVKEPAAAVAQPGKTYLQVVAVKKPDAEMIAGILRKKGFPHAIVVPGPSETIFRVLVGPLEDAAAISKTKMDLEAAGFKAIPRKY